MNLDKKRAEELQGDFVPGGKPIDIHKLSFRIVKEHEIYQCCHRVANDPQSGPIFCGRVAEYVTEIKDGESDVTGVVALCKRHAPPKECII